LAIENPPTIGIHDQFVEDGIIVDVDYLGLNISEFELSVARIRIVFEHDATNA
jgi:hypothetical protein